MYKVYTMLSSCLVGVIIGLFPLAMEGKVVRVTYADENQAAVTHSVQPADVTKLKTPEMDIKENRAPSTLPVPVEVKPPVEKKVSTPESIVVQEKKVPPTPIQTKKETVVQKAPVQEKKSPVRTPVAAQEKKPTVSAPPPVQEKKPAVSAPPPAQEKKPASVPGQEKKTSATAPVPKTKETPDTAPVNPDVPIEPTEPQQEEMAPVVPSPQDTGVPASQESYKP